jgi:hypothetical protein
MKSFTQFVFLSLLVTFEALQSPKKVDNSGILSQAVSNGAKLRIYHPAFPLKLQDTVSLDDALRNLEIKAASRNEPISLSSFKQLPWAPLPKMGFSNEQDLWSRAMIDTAWERYQYQGIQILTRVLFTSFFEDVMVTYYLQGRYYGHTR